MELDSEALWDQSFLCGELLSYEFSFFKDIRLFRLCQFINCVFLRMCLVAWNFNCICIKLFKYILSCFLIICRICSKTSLLRSIVGNLDLLSSWSVVLVVLLLSVVFVFKEQLLTLICITCAFYFISFSLSIFLGLICFLSLCSWDGDLHRWF